MKIHWRGRPHTLSAADFVAQGGEAKVYTRDGKALKLFTTATPPLAKLNSLSALAGPGIVAPEEPVYDDQGDRIGYSMAFLAGWRPLVQLFARSYRERNGLDATAIASLVLELRSLVERAHLGGALVVDLNELNVLIRPDHRSVALIDVDSWQLPGFPATALAPSIKDHRSQGFSTGTDWYAFAAISFQLFSGIHPFRGKHPTVKGLEQRMKRGLSVFHPEVVVPPMAELNTPWQTWYQAVFDRGERCPPPTTIGSVAPASLLLPPRSATHEVVLSLPQPLRGVAGWAGAFWSWTDDGLYTHQRRVGDAPPAGALPLSGPAGVHFAQVCAGRIQLWQNGWVNTGLHADVLNAHQGMLHGRVGANLVSFSLGDRGNQTMLQPKVVAAISAHSTQLHRGVAFRSVFGSVWMLTLGLGTCHQTRCPQLDGQQVLDAVHTQGVVVVITQHGPSYERHVFGPDGHRVGPTDVPEAQLEILPRGLAMLVTEGGLELFQASSPCGTRRQVRFDLPAPLTQFGGQPGFIDGRSWKRITLGG